MRNLLAATLLSCSSLASAAVVNVEFNFTPFVGNPKADHVEMVPGKAVVFINNVPMAEQDVEKRDAMVMFDHEVGAAVWMPASSMGPALRKGKNRILIEFTPTNPKAAYDVQFRWASVTDGVTEKHDGPGRVSATNQADEGAENRKVTGKAVLEREFVADFAADRPWHHFPPVTALSDADKQALAALAAARAEAFKPGFSAAYQLLASANTPGVQLNPAGIRKSKLFDKAYKAGVRFVALPADKLDFAVTGNAEVVIGSRKGAPYDMPDPNTFERVKASPENMMGLAMALGALYPPALVAVRDAAGKWSVAYGSAATTVQPGR